MKPSEVMIGDYLLDRSGFPKKVDEVLDDGVLLGGVYHHMVEMQGVPLTPEIFQANGYEIRTWNESYSKGYENKHLICPFFIEYMFVNQCLFVNEGLVPTPVYYVHQLQHALRLCGLNDEADNFKLEGDIK